MKIFLVILITAHGLIHLMGFAKAFALAELDQLKGAISRRAGIMWLLAALLFIVAAILILLDRDYWWMAAAPAVVLSQTLILISWGDAKFGTAANVLILVPLLIAVMNDLPSSFGSIYKAEVRKGLLRSAEPAPVREEDIRHLPKSVQTYLSCVGAVGRPRVMNFRAAFTGEFRRTMESGWMSFASRQYDFFEEPTRVFFIGSTLFGVPFEALHLYGESGATMQIRVASLFNVADAKGPEMNQGETVTLFNDMCLLAPATLIDTAIRWEEIGPLAARARFTNNGYTIAAVLRFNERGELTDFTSGDRFFSTDGKSYENYEWSTPAKDYRDIDGRRVAGFVETVWHTPQGDFVYGRFGLAEIEYNGKEYR